jgi:alkaline phosphatase
MKLTLSSSFCTLGSFRMICTVCTMTVAMLLSACSSDLTFKKGIKDSRSAERWFQQGEERVQKRKIEERAEEKETKAKNIIFVLGDGMGVSTLTAARIYVGQQQGLLGEEFALSFEEFPYTALIKTYNVDLQTPDSAGTMSALMTGVKTNEGIISLPDSVQRADCASMPKNSLPTFIDLAKAKGKSTAMITTARVTHATPAVTYAHSVDRNWESDETIPAHAQAIGCTDIASQFVNNDQRSLDILLGGGRRHFLPKEEGGKRNDKRNLIKDWQQQGEYASTLAELETMVTKAEADNSSDNMKPWLGLFSNSHMGYAYQRPVEQPSLQQMTAAALTRLEKNKQGYALVIEAGRIDHGHHDGTAYKALTETQELHETVAWLLTQVDTRETLIVVTADHSHTLTLAGYATRGNPILGDVVANDTKGYPKQSASLDLAGNSYTSLGYRDGPGATDAEQDSEKDSEQNGLANDDPNYRQTALVPMDYETHGGEDVALYAIGPQAQLLSGTLEQHWVFHALKYAMQKQ